ncbi:MAG: hypothetical protein CMC05_10425 [Flavobacteriaceae bacterium]|nr:hypothetical protein [Flavobacteriaceae bacterium]MBD09891.1 hypothetical protein [Flavobacteriaceae bacterium]|tara:strand:+ start:10542 stop:11291 length:750 start_codon:yes stop_codon:yes gene_type:complete
MAKYKSLFDVQGTLGEVTFYKGEDGQYVRRKGGVSKNRILKDPNFERTRENLSEFGRAATSGKLMRRAINSLMLDAKDSRVTSRLTKVLNQVKNEDLTSARGQRNVATGLANPLGRARLKGFNFNAKSELDTVLMAQYTLDSATGEIVISDLIPNQQISAPEGATHLSFSAGFLNLDLATETKDLQLSNVVNLPINGIASTVTLTPAVPAVGTGQSYYVLKVAFFQEINGIQYPLKNGAFNALQLIELL